MLKDYGTVISTRILRKPDGVSRGVGFARMESKEKCEQVINSFNGKILPGKYLQILLLQVFILHNIFEKQTLKSYFFINVAM